MTTRTFSQYLNILIFTLKIIFIDHDGNYFFLRKIKNNLRT